MNTENDNEGRRSGLRSAFANDPLYRRVKDAMLIIAAIAAVMSNSDVKNFFKGDEKVPSIPSEARSRMWERINANDQAIAVIQVSLRSIEKGQDDMRQDVRELLAQVGRIRR